MEQRSVIILGIESATSQVGCAIGGHEGVLSSVHSSRGKRHAENLTPQIEFVLEQARIAMDEISVVAVDIGPGLYTGLRGNHYCSFYSVWSRSSNDRGDKS